MCREKYYGWMNYETWLASVWLANDRGGWELLCEARRQPGSVVDKADWLWEQLSNSLESALVYDGVFGEGSLFIDLIRSALEDVNCRELVEKV